MKILTRLFALYPYVFSSQQLYSQLIVGTVGTPEELAESLVGSGVVISNVTLNCPNGAWGSFDATDASLGMDSGIILACGNITNAVGPNLSTGITTDFLQTVILTSKRWQGKQPMMRVCWNLMLKQRVTH